MPRLLFLQGHKLATSESIDEASTLCERLGYSSLWTPASAGKGGKTIAGTAIGGCQFGYGHSESVALGNEPPLTDWPSREMIC